MILWFPFSSLVNAHREKIVSNLAKFAMVIWLFVVLILSSSYTASLSSRLTLQRLQPIVTDVNSLIKNGDYVGYQYGSVVGDILKGMKFNESKLKSYKSREDCHEALLKGSKNNGISAFFDVVPRNTIFLSKYCDKYMAIGPLYRTEGFAFVFPKGSPLVADISRAVIAITEGRKILDTEQHWFGNTTCPERNSFTSNSLTLQSFIGLFIITGCVTVLCLIVYVVKYIYGNIDLLKRIWNSSTTNWSRFCALCRHFDQRDLSSYPFSKKRDRIDQDLELNDIGGSFHFSDAPSFSRNSNSNEMVSPVEVDDAIEGVDPNSEDMAVVHI